MCSLYVNIIITNCVDLKCHAREKYCNLKILANSSVAAQLMSNYHTYYIVQQRYNALQLRRDVPTL